MDMIRIVIVAVGGQGNLLASHLLGEAALAHEVPVQISEIHGMAQRGGVVESSILLGKAQSNIISPGEADILVSFEPLETLRAIGKCNKDSIVLSNTAPLPPFTVAIGMGVYPPVEETMNLIGAQVRKNIAFDASSLARQAGTLLSLNMVMLGALAGTGLIPVSADMLKQTISEKTKKAFLEMNLKAFDLGYAVSSGAIH
ncbi:MAG: indolepyruvate oxidoreductase subunit beta [Syntrophales bacterium]|jgi:indolepyruvate ferredoxin oxidoreductase beta subunit|nr:indolepyruvate oxidoreductase subunit beta [Syntrophales bacterium]